MLKRREDEHEKEQMIKHEKEQMIKHEKEQMIKHKQEQKIKHKQEKEKIEYDAWDKLKQQLGSFAVGGKERSRRSKKERKLKKR